MNRIASYAAPFACGIGLTIGLIVFLGAAKSQQEETAFDTQIVSAPGGMVLAINDHNKNRLYLYNLPSPGAGNAKLLGNIDLSAAGKDELPQGKGVD